MHNPKKAAEYSKCNVEPKSWQGLKNLVNDVRNLLN